jgi:RNA polymerase sigma-70 factor (ECF subfamily)
MRELTVSELERLASQTDVADVAFQMDEETFRAFYDRTARGLWGYLSRLTGDRHVAEDLLQETYYRFLRANREYESEAHRRNSLFRIATNLVTDMRRKPFTVTLPDPASTRQLQVDGDLADRAVERTDVRRALGTLKPRERALLWLAYAHGASHREIASVLGVKTASIKLLLFRARKKLAGVLRSEGRS